MKMKVNRDSSEVRVLKISFFKLVLLGQFIISVTIILSQGAQAQGCFAILKISDPAAVCSPSTVDLTSAAIIAGSTDGLEFSYFTNRELTSSVPDPKAVKAGIYYIKGALIGSRPAWVAGSVKVSVSEKPQMKINSPIVKSTGENVDLTSPLIKSGSDAGLIFSYWSDYEATKQLPSPESKGKGTYFIKGTSVNGCFDIQTITINE